MRRRQKHRKRQLCLQATANVRVEGVIGTLTVFMEWVSRPEEGDQSFVLRAEKANKYNMMQNDSLRIWEASSCTCYGYSVTLFCKSMQL